MKPVHLVLFLRALKSPNTAEAVGRRNRKSGRFLSLRARSRVMGGAWCVYWSCSCRFLVGLGVAGCAYEICQIQIKGVRMFLSF